MVHHQFESSTVAASEAIKTILEPLLEADEHIPRLDRLVMVSMCGHLRAMVRLQDIFGHGRHQCVRQDEGGNHRIDNRFRHRWEDPAGEPSQMKQRDPDNRDGECGHECGEEDLIGGIDDCLFQGLALGEVGIDIFDHHRGVVDENADGQRQSAQGHNVNRLFLNMQ